MTADITSAQAYSPYGTNLSSAGDSETPYGFTGEITDATGNIYLRARYYNPNDGRFINRDTFPGYSTLSQSQNRFIYVENNPIRYTDPTGHHYSWDDFVAEGLSLINDPVQHTLDQIEKNRNLPFECTDVGQIVQWAAPALAPLIIVAAIPIILVSPDSILDLGFMAYDLAVGDYQAFYLDAMALMIPGVTGLGMLSKADDAYRSLNSLEQFGVLDEFMSPLQTGQYRNWTEIPTSKLRFTQNEVSPLFSSRGGNWAHLSIEEVMSGLRSGKFELNNELLVFMKTPNMNSWPTRKVVQPDGTIYSGSFKNLEDYQIYSINNRGLTVSAWAQTDKVPVKWATEKEINYFSYEYDTKNFGQSIWIRIQNITVPIPGQ